MTTQKVATINAIVVKMSIRVLNSGTTGLGDKDVLAKSEMTETVLSPALVTNISYLSESYAMPMGLVPTIIFAITVFDLSDMTETELSG
jgi:hypothetical protein